MLEKFDAVIFDLDGTLIDSMGLWQDVDRIYLKRHGYDMPNDLKKALEGMSFREAVVYIKNRFNIEDDIEKMTDDLHDMAEEYYREIVETKTSTVKLLEKIKSLNKPIAIATSNTFELASMALINNGIKEYFDCVVTADEVKKGKPSPDVFLEASARLNVKPENCLVFEDTHAGVKGAKEANMTVFAVYDFHSEESIEEIKMSADMFIMSFDEIL